MRWKRDRNVFSSSRIDALEARRLLTAKPPAQIMIQEVPSTLVPGTATLEITGTKKNDGIVINDNGTGTAGNVFVSLSNGTDYTSVGAITEIAVITGAGKDQVTYELDGNLQSGVDQFVFVGSNTKNGGGTLQLTANIVGAVLDGSSLTIAAQGDRTKPTTMNVHDSGNVEGSLSTGLVPSISGKKVKVGPESYSFASTAKIAMTGSISTILNGSTKNDTGNVIYSGENDGVLEVTENGGGGNDQLSADIYMTPLSTGSVGKNDATSTISAAGKSHMQYTIHQGTNSTSTLNIFALVNGTSKKTRTVRTANVQSITTGSDSIVT